MSASKHAHARCALAAAALVAFVPFTAHAQRTTSEALGVPAHETVEDPLNRAVRFDELEGIRGGADLSWDASAWVGYALNKITLRTEGERADGDTERAELQVLFTHAAARWWDVVAGVREDIEPGSGKTWAAFGVQGLAPYRFDLEATAFVAEGGDTAARFETSYAMLVTRRLILEPELELDWYGQSDLSRGHGPGLASGELALRLRYEIRREIAPYVGWVRERRFGTSADLARAAGHDPDDTSFVAGIRVQF